MKLELVTKKDVTYVELQKDKKHSFGISIRDGTQDEGGPVIKKVEQKSPAAKSFAVSKDDVILSVNGYSTAGARCKDVRRMLKNAGANVDLQLLYKTRETSILECSAYKKQQIAIRLRKVNGSFGFLLRKKTSKYSFSMQYPVVTNIKEGSPAYKGGQLQEGDRLLMIDGVSLSWMSLSYIASLLQEKEEAEFTFEYSVGIFNFVEEGAKLELEIDLPVADLGLDIRACDEERTMMYIGNIRLGGIAERCGIFSEGDVILSINDIETKDLTFPKAYFLLRNAKKSRKISFISNRPKEKIAETPQENACSSTDDNEDDDDMVTTESYSSSSRTVDWKHLNTPASSNFAFSEQQKYNFQSFCYREQVKTVDKFQSIFAILSSLKQNLSTLTREAFRGTQNMLSRNCTSCNRAQHTVKLCTSCLARMNVKCAQSMDVLRNLVAHFVRFSTNGVYEREKRQFGVSVIDVTRLLSETLPGVLGVPELKECFTVLARKITSADATCSTCDFEVKSVMMVVQQLLLVLTVTDNSQEFEDLIEHLVSCLLSMKFTCDGETESMRSTAGEYVSSSENVSESVRINIEEESSSRSSSSRVKNNSETESNGVQISIESNLNFPQVKASVNREYLKLTHIKSLSESRNSVSANPNCESNALGGASLVGSRTKLLEESATKTSMTSVASETATATRVKRLIKSMKLPKVWRSLDSLIRPRRPSQVPSKTQNACHPKRDQCKSNDSSTVKSKVHNASTRSAKNRLSPSYAVGQKGRKVSDSNGESTPSLSKLPQDDSNSTKPSKTQPETMKVTLENEGNGFGLDIGFIAGSRIPIINTIHPKSPALKIGVLKVGDRILAINQRNTSRISPKQLMSLKKKAFSADNITLAVEFDIEDEVYRFGTFDVVLKRTLKTGLIFEDMKKDSPMIVSAIAKGSAAHRCGQLFPGDKIKYFRYSKNEEFNPVSSRYIREEHAIITVHRDPCDVIEAAKRRANRSPCYVNPCFHPEDTSKTGVSFVVKKTAVRSMENRDALVLDHEVTLFRDPKSFDFGILLGEDPATGRAYVKDIRPDGPAHKSGVIKKYDRIVEVNGVLVNRNVSNSVLELLSRANQQVDLLIRRIYQEELSES